MYHSYDWKGDEVEREYPKIFKARVDGFVKVVRAMDQAKLKQAKERRFVRPGGAGTPSGAANTRLKNSDIADMVFGKENAAT